MTDDTKNVDEAAAETIVDQDAEDQKMFDDAVAADAGGEHPEAQQEDDKDQAAALEGDAQDDKDQAAADADAKDDKEAEPDIWEGSTEAQSTAFKDVQSTIGKLENQVKSTAGRESNLQIKLNDLQKQMDAALKGDATEQEANELMAEFFESELWKNHREDFPEITAPTEAAFNKLTSEIKTLTERVAAVSNKQGEVDQGAVNKGFQDNLDILKEAHEDWDAVTDSQEFQDWLPTQPRFVQNMAIRNGDNIVDPAEAIDLLQRFKDQNKPAGDDPDPDEGKADAELKSLAAKRDLQLKSSRSPRGKGKQPVNAGVPEDDEGAFKYYVEQDRKKEAASS